MGETVVRTDAKLIRLTLVLLLAISASTVVLSHRPTNQVQASAADAQQQVAQIVPNLIDSEAESADGTYVPGVGAVFTLELVRGPNTTEGKSAAEGTFDWVVYLMQTFGTQLQAVPANEIIAFSVRYYDFDVDTFHLLVMSVIAGDVAVTDQYVVTIDGEPYRFIGDGSSSMATPLAQSTNAAGTPVAVSTPGAVEVTLGFDDPAATYQWLPVSGLWSIADGSYRQTELGLYDLVSYFYRPVAGDYQVRAQLQYLDGQMGGGIIFNAPDPASKDLAQMVSFAGGGTFLQWGSYDRAGVFQYQGGVDVAPGAGDGSWHSIAISTSGTTYNVILDGKEVARGVPLVSAPGGYVGLLASTSAVAFDNVEIMCASR